MYLICPHFQWKVSNQCRMFKAGLREQIWCSMFKVDRCSMYPGSLPWIFNGSVPGHEKLFNVHRCSIWQVPLYYLFPHLNMAVWQYFRWIKIIASEARKAVGLSRSLAIPQLRVCVYECIWRHYHYKKYIHGPRKLSPSHVRDNNIVQRAGQQYHSTCGRLPFWRISLGVK